MKNSEELFLIFTVLLNLKTDFSNYNGVIKNTNFYIQQSFPGVYTRRPNKFANIQECTMKFSMHKSNLKVSHI